MNDRSVDEGKEIVAIMYFSSELEEKSYNIRHVRRERELTWRGWERRKGIETTASRDCCTRILQVAFHM